MTKSQYFAFTNAEKLDILHLQVQKYEILSKTSNFLVISLTNLMNLTGLHPRNDLHPVFDTRQIAKFNAKVTIPNFINLKPSFHFCNIFICF